MWKILTILAVASPAYADATAYWKNDPELQSTLKNKNAYILKNCGCSVEWKPKFSDFVDDFDKETLRYCVEEFGEVDQLCSSYGEEFRTWFCKNVKTIAIVKGTWRNGDPDGCSDTDVTQNPISLVKGTLTLYGVKGDPPWGGHFCSIGKAPPDLPENYKCQASHELVLKAGLKIKNAKY